MIFKEISGSYIPPGSMPAVDKHRHRAAVQRPSRPESSEESDQDDSTRRQTPPSLSRLSTRILSPQPEDVKVLGHRALEVRDAEANSQMLQLQRAREEVAEMNRQHQAHVHPLSAYTPTGVHLTAAPLTMTVPSVDWF